MITSSLPLFDENQKECPKSDDNECENENGEGGAGNKHTLTEAIRPNLYRPGATIAIEKIRKWDKKRERQQNGQGAQQKLRESHLLPLSIITQAHAAK